MFALLVGASGRSAGAAKLARASAAKSSGRAELATGAWAMSDAYINRTATKSCGEPVQAWCARRSQAKWHAKARTCGDAAKTDAAGARSRRSAYEGSGAIRRA